MASNAFLSFFADDNNYEDEEEEHLPVNNGFAVHHTIVSGGPVEPNYTGMTAAVANMADMSQWIPVSKLCPA